MDENQLLVKLIDVLSGSPSTWSSIILAGVVLKKYVINGSIKAFLLLKEQEVNSTTTEVKSLAAIEASLERIIQGQHKLYERLSNQ